MKWRDELRGMGHVYRFTLIQHVKNRANIISLVIMLVLALISMPLASVLMGGSLADDAAQPDVGLPEGGRLSDSPWLYISELYVYDGTGLSLMSFTDAGSIMALTVHELTEEMSAEDAAKLPEEALYIAVAENTESGSYRIETYTGDTCSLTEAEIHNCALALANALDAVRLQGLNETEQAFLLQLGAYHVERGDAEELLQAGEEVNYETSFAVEYFYAILVLMLCMMSSSYILRAIVEEKSSKLIDLLMVSVQPLALLCGKILAMMTVVFGTLLAVGAAFGLSSAIAGMFFDTSVIGGGLEGMGISLSLLDLGRGTILVVLVSLFLSYLTFSIMSGIAGATCSSMSDTEGAMMGVTLTLLAGYIVSCVVAAIPSRAVAVVSALIPFVSAFCAPVQFVFGRIGVPVLLLSWAIQAVVVVVLARFGAKVYRDLILHRGKRLRLREVLRMAKNRKGGARREA